MSEGTALEWTKRRTIEEINEEIEMINEEIVTMCKEVERLL